MERRTDLPKATPRPMLRRSSSLGRQTPASERQRLAVGGEECLVCGRSPVDPAHLVPQRLGGCREADCVVPLCRAHHRLFDEARLRLAPFIGEADGPFGPQLRHALRHVSAEQLRRALEGGWPPPWDLDDEHEEESDEQLKAGSI